MPRAQVGAIDAEMLRPQPVDALLELLIRLARGELEVGEQAEQLVLVDLVQGQRALKVVAEALGAGGGIAHPRQLADQLGHLRADLLAGFPRLAHLDRVLALVQDRFDLVVVQFLAADTAAEVDVLGAHVGFQTCQLVDRGVVLLVARRRQVDQLELSRQQRVLGGPAVMQPPGLGVQVPVGPEAHPGCLRLLIALVGFGGSADGRVPLRQLVGLVEGTDAFNGLTHKGFHRLSHRASSCHERSPRGRGTEV